jgi:two-component system cell cycle sensor histidine kinase/response regulator CckA
VKVVFMSGYTDDKVSGHGISDEQGLFLQKPFTIETLSQKVRDALELSR